MVYIQRNFFPLTVGTCRCDDGSLRTDCTVLKLDNVSGVGLDKWLPV